MVEFYVWLNFLASEATYFWARVKVIREVPLRDNQRVMLGNRESVVDSEAKLILSYDTPSADLTEDTSCLTITVAI